MDVLDFREFYTTPLGDIVHSEINEVISKIWPHFQTPLANDPSIQRTLGYGFATPYLPEKSTYVTFMPAHTGVIGWPKNAPSRTALIEEDLLPLPDRCIDRLVVIHGFELCHNPIAFLEECWRVLTNEGRLLIITPNRRGLWARIDTTPFGHGRPYTMTQLTKCLKDASFAPTQTLRSLYTPPFNSNLGISLNPIFEKIGPYLFPKFSGLIAIESTKELYKAVPSASYSKRFKLNLATTYAGKQTASSSTPEKR